VQLVAFRPVEWVAVGVDPDERVVSLVAVVTPQAAAGGDGTRDVGLLAVGDLPLGASIVPISK
jgi:hypothetical protein